MIFDAMQKDLIVAMKAHDSALVSLLRMLVSQLKYKMIDGGEKTIDDETAIAVLRSEVKKRNESIEIFERVGDLKRTEQEKYEKAQIEKYLPKLMVESEVEKAIENEANSSGKRGGVLIGAMMMKLKGQVDGAVVSRIVQEKWKA